MDMLRSSEGLDGTCHSPSRALTPNHRRCTGSKMRRKRQGGGQEHDDMKDRVMSAQMTTHRPQVLFRIVSRGETRS